MSQLKLIDAANIVSLSELNDWFMTDELTYEHFEDIDKLKNWIEETTDCIWHIAKCQGTIYIKKYLWA